jgi:hypothetical protein
MRRQRVPLYGTVVMRPGDDGRGERVIVITQSESDIPGGVTIHRYYGGGCTYSC